MVLQVVKFRHHFRQRFSPLSNFLVCKFTTSPPPPPPPPSSPPSSGHFITTPIFYVNAQPHIGHLYTSVVADTYHRYRKLQRPTEGEGGLPPIFSTGTDEHGMKIEKAAKKEGLPDGKTILHCDKVSKSFRDMTQQFSIDCTDFVRTTEPRHFKAVSHFWVSGKINMNDKLKLADF